ncbi:MAG: hypothetical protein WA211_09305 [Candidatus Acidiferrales bacterium]
MEFRCRGCIERRHACAYRDVSPALLSHPEENVAAAGLKIDEKLMQQLAKAADA